MHELSVSENILEIALRHARPVQAKKISDVYLVIGQLSSIIDDSVQFYWDFISKDTPAEGARLHFKRIQAEFHCLDCDQAFMLSSSDLGCPNCSSSNVKITAGEEFYLEAIEVEA
jgi:hydrogenase nickel incorporation protein HypA/HybF